MGLTVFCDNAVEYDWFCGLHGILEGADEKQILARGKNPKHIDDLVFYDRPDIILCSEDKPLLVVEKTREVPTGHNIGQRIARLVRALEFGVPTIKFFPFDAMKHGTYSNKCALNIRILHAFDKMWTIHKTPIVAMNWRCDSNGELVCDGTEDSEIKSFIKGFVSSGFRSDTPVFDTLKNKQRNEYNRRLAARASYGKPPPSVTLIETSKFISELPFRVSQADLTRLTRKSRSLIYKIDMSEEKCRREDPYTGMQFIYDYSYCRTGKSPGDKSRNLILQFPSIRKEIWQKANPNDPSRKSCNWYLTATALVFVDGVIYLR